jgi:hypothetical protein
MISISEIAHYQVEVRFFDNEQKETWNAKNGAKYDLKI